MGIRDEDLMQLCVAPMHGVAVVAALDEAAMQCTVQTAQGAVPARQAASCLMSPQVGDRVWLVGDLAHGLYVTAILERAQTGACELRLPPDSVLSVPAGALTVRAPSLRVVAGEAGASFGRVKLVADLLESFADKVSQFARWSQKVVEGPDQVRSRHIDYRADQTLQLQAEHLIANGSKLVKADGEQIHLG